MEKEKFTYLWSERAIFRLDGQSAERYLQGRCTQDVKSINVGKSKEAFILTPQGKIEGKFRINRSENSFLIITDPLNEKNRIEDFTTSFLKFKVADQLDFINATDEFLVLSMFNYTDQEIESLKNKISEEICDSLQIYSDNSGNKFGTETLIFFEMNSLKDTQKSIVEKIAEIFSPVSEEFFLKFRIEHLLPLMGVDVDNTVLAPEVDFDSFVALGKGCYAGQEVVEMATARGRPNRQFVQFTSGFEFPETIENREIVQADGTKVGRLTSSLNTKDGFLGMGFLKTKALGSDALYLAVVKDDSMLKVVS